MKHLALISLLIIILATALKGIHQERQKKYVAYRIDEFQMLAVSEYRDFLKMPMSITDHAWLLYEGPYLDEAERIANQEWRKHPSYSYSLCNCE
jgi:hypothetical protein